jgi:hypothetical protein
LLAAHHCVASQASSTSTISPISQSRVRVRHQPVNGQGARHRGAGNVARTYRRRDRLADRSTAGPYITDARPKFQAAAIRSTTRRFRPDRRPRRLIACAGSGTVSVRGWARCKTFRMRSGPATKRRSATTSNRMPIDWRLTFHRVVRDKVHKPFTGAADQQRLSCVRLTSDCC